MLFDSPCSLRTTKKSFLQTPVAKRGTFSCLFGASLVAYSPYVDDTVTTIWEKKSASISHGGDGLS